MATLYDIDAVRDGDGASPLIRLILDFLFKSTRSRRRDTNAILAFPQVARLFRDAVIRGGRGVWAAAMPSLVGLPLDLRPIFFRNRGFVRRDLSDYFVAFTSREHPSVEGSFASYQLLSSLLYPQSKHLPLPEEHWETVGAKGYLDQLKTLRGYGVLLDADILGVDEEAYPDYLHLFSKGGGMCTFEANAYASGTCWFMFGAMRDGVFKCRAISVHRKDDGKTLLILTDEMEENERGVREEDPPASDFVPGYLDRCLS